MIDNPQLQNKLFQITVKPRPLFQNPRIVLPQSLAPMAPEEIFDSEDSPRVMELGAGWGEFCLSWVEANPSHEYLALEVKYDRVHKLLKKSEKLGIKNFKVMPVNFNWFFTEILPPQAFDIIIINFPDPWPKRRHWKHRLVQADFPEKAAGLLRPGGQIRLATDHGPYARRMLGAFRRSPLFEPVYDWPNYRRQRPEDHFETKFESIHFAEGRTPYYQIWKLASK